MLKFKTCVVLNMYFACVDIFPVYSKVYTIVVKNQFRVVELHSSIVRKKMEEREQTKT